MKMYTFMEISSQCIPVFAYKSNPVILKNWMFHMTHCMMRHNVITFIQFWMIWSWKVSLLLNHFQYLSDIFY